MEAERIQVGKCTVVVHRPELTSAERAHRLEAIKKAAVNLVVATEAARRKKATT
jgi:hypothetical protein